MIEALYALGGFGALAVLVWAVRSIKRWGAAKYKLDEAEKKLEGIENAKKIHDRVSRDNDFRKLVRDKFR